MFIYCKINADQVPGVSGIELISASDNHLHSVHTGIFKICKIHGFIFIDLMIFICQQIPAVVFIMCPYHLSVVGNRKRLSFFIHHLLEHRCDGHVLQLFIRIPIKHQVCFFFFNRQHCTNRISRDSFPCLVCLNNWCHYVSDSTISNNDISVSFFGRLFIFFSRLFGFFIRA